MKERIEPSILKENDFKLSIEEWIDEIEENKMTRGEDEMIKNLMRLFEDEKNHGETI